MCMHLISRHTVDEERHWWMNHGLNRCGGEGEHTIFRVPASRMSGAPDNTRHRARLRTVGGRDPRRCWKIFDEEWIQVSAPLGSFSSERGDLPGTFTSARGAGPQQGGRGIIFMFRLGMPLPGNTVQHCCHAALRPVQTQRTPRRSAMSQGAACRHQPAIARPVGLLGHLSAAAQPNSHRRSETGLCHRRSGSELSASATVCSHR